MQPNAATASDPIEKRRVRFANLPHAGTADILVACEIWLDDLVKAPWVTREAMRLGAHLVNYITAANPANLHIREMETVLQLNREEINRALGLMRLFRAVTVCSIERDEVRTSLQLSSLQLLRLLEHRKAYLALLTRA